MSEFVTAAEGRIGFRKSDYVKHKVELKGDFMGINDPQVFIWTRGGKGTPYKFQTDIAAKLAGKEIAAQLTHPSEEGK